MNSTTNGSNPDTDSYMSAAQLRLVVGKLQGRKGQLPLSTWKRWRSQLALTGDRLYGPDQVRLVVSFCGWLASGGTVEGFQLTHGITPRQQTQEGTTYEFRQSSWQCSSEGDYIEI